MACSFFRGPQGNLLHWGKGGRSWALYVAVCDICSLRPQIGDPESSERGVGEKEEGLGLFMPLETASDSPRPQIGDPESSERGVGEKEEGLGLFMSLYATSVV